MMRNDAGAATKAARRGVVTVAGELLKPEITMRTLKLVAALSIAGAISLASYAAGAGCTPHTSFRSCEANLQR